jgi:hypothetical protein
VLFQKEQPGDIRTQEFLLTALRLKEETGRCWSRAPRKAANTADDIEPELTPRPDLDEIAIPRASASCATRPSCEESRWQIAARSTQAADESTGLGLVHYGEPAGGAGAGWSGGGVAGEVSVAFSGSVFFSRFLVGPSLRQ